MLTSARLDEVLRQASNSQATHHGGNSTVTRVRSGTTEYAVKDYSGREDGLKRQRQETAALILLNPGLNRYFAEPVGVAVDGLCAVHSWIDGIHPATNDQTVASMLEILSALHDLSKTTNQGRARPATDQVIRPEQLRQQMEGRISRLVSGPPDVQSVTHERLIPATKCLLTPGDGLRPPVLTLSPSDFGAHNLLWDEPAQSMHCVDLEFFGWDDAHKLVCDTLLHPLAQWSQGTAEGFLHGTVRLYQLDMRRLAWLWPRLCLKWAAISLARASREISLGNAAAREQAIKRAVNFIGQAESAAPDAASMVEQIIVNRWEEHA